MQTIRIIGIETSSRRGSVALAEGPNVVAEAEFSTQTQHARELLPSLEELYRRAGWPRGKADQCYVSIGPGSFTGLRVAVAFARHLALAGATQIVAVPTLAVVAENCASFEPPPTPLAVVLDAKRGQVFAAVFEWREGAYHGIEAPHLASPRELISRYDEKISVTGEGIDYHKEAIASSGATVVDPAIWMPRAASVCRLGWRLAEQGAFIPARDLIPLYIRRPEAEEVWENRQAGMETGKAAR
jgi:tRNA threonylcarbamoyladenosine biosynthesis protein TsaB